VKNLRGWIICDGGFMIYGSQELFSAVLKIAANHIYRLHEIDLRWGAGHKVCGSWKPGSAGFAVRNRRRSRTSKVRMT